jgi:hypothetical protein
MGLRRASLVAGAPVYTKILIERDVISSAQCLSPSSICYRNTETNSTLYNLKSPCQCLRHPHQYFSFDLITLSFPLSLHLTFALLFPPANIFHRGFRHSTSLPSRKSSKFHGLSFCSTPHRLWNDIQNTEHVQ